MSFLNCTEINDGKMILCGENKYTLGDHLDHRGGTQFYIDIGVVAGLVLLAGLMSGLTMGLMSMDKLNLKILANGTDEQSKKHAGRILPLVERHHWLLVTLLLSNAACAEALPIFLDRLVHPALAVILSVTLVLMFGEIIPQAVCTRYGLKVGSYLAWFVWIMIALLAPIAWPIAKLLDLVLGKDTGTFFRRAELKELVHLHAEDEHAPEGESLTIDEVRIIKGAIDMKEKTVAQAYTPIDKVFAIDINSVLTREVLQQIVDSGHDRIPVFHLSRDHFIGMILVKDLVLIDPNGNVPVRDIRMYRVPMVGSDMHLYDMLHQFQSGRSHMSLVLDCEDHITPEGIITLEDVIEELLQEEILDEDDVRRQNGGINHDVKLAKAFVPRKSIALDPAQARKLSVMIQGGNAINSQGVDLRRRPTVAGTMAPGYQNPSHVVNFSPAPHQHPSGASHHRSMSNVVNFQSPAPYPPRAAASASSVRVVGPPPAYSNPPPAPTTNNNNNEQAPLLPRGGGKPAN